MSTLFLSKLAHGLAVLLLSLALVSGVQGALFSEKSSVIRLTPANFEHEILNINKPALVAFTAPWCGHCKNLAPHFTRVANELDGVVKLAYLDCDDASLQSICTKYDVKGFPTIKLFPATKRRIPREYVGERRGKAIMDFALDALPSEVVRKVDAADLSTFLDKESSANAKLVLVTPIGKTSPMYRSLALDYYGRIPFAFVYAGKDGVVETVQKVLDPELTKDKLPGLYFVSTQNSKHAVKYRGSMRYRYIKLWIDEQLGGAEAEAAQAAREAEAKAEADAKAQRKAEAKARAEAKAQAQARSREEEETAYGVHEDDNLKLVRQLESLMADAQPDDSDEAREAELQRLKDRKLLKKLLDAREKLKKEEGVIEQTPDGPVTKELLAEKLREHLGDKWGMRLAEHADKTQKTIERLLMENPDDTKRAMNVAEKEFVELLQADEKEIQDQLQAGADADGYPLQKDAIEVMHEHLGTITGLISTIEFRISAREAGLDEKKVAQEMLKRFHDEL